MELRNFRFVASFCLLVLAHASYAQMPSVTNGTPSESFLGEQFCFDTTLTNTGAPGFGPYLRLIIPADLSFDSASIFGGSAMTTAVGTFPAAPGNQLTDPVIGTPVTGPPGGSFVTIRLPVGSVVTGGPDLITNICLTIEPTAIVGTPLDVSLQPIYQFGDTATGDNGPIEGTANVASVVPTVITFDKTNNAPEGERPPGPSWPFNYLLTVDIANTAVINPIQITDQLPPEVQFLGPVSITGGTGCSVTTEPTPGTPGGNIVVDCNGDTTGTTSGTDIVITYPVHIIDILDETICDADTLVNNATLDAAYVPPSGPDQVLPQIPADSTVSSMHVELQKGVTPSTVSPGELVTYTLAFQVSDFADVNRLVATDTLPDGTQFNSHLSLSVNGGPVAIAPTVTPNPDGTTTIIYDIGAVTGTISAGSNVIISFTADVQQTFINGDPVLASDSLNNTVVADYDLVQGATACNDDSAAAVTVIPIQLQKSILNLQPFYVPGDVVTFVLNLSIPSGDTSAIQFVDVLPLPVFVAADVDLTFGNDIRLGANDTLGLTPTSITADAATNSITINWPDVTTATSQVLEIEIDATVTDDPFDDGLFLTNLVQASTNNTPGATATSVAPVMLLIGAPELVITKGVSAVDNPNATIAPAPTVSPVDGNVTNVDAGDTITYQVTIENIGSAQAFDVQATDTANPQLSCTLVSVTDGTGTPLASSGDLFNTPLVLTDPLAANDGNPAGGGAPFAADTAIVTSDCVVNGSVMPNQTLDNDASVVWASQPGAVPFPAETDSASAATAGAAGTKFFVSSSETTTSDASNPPRATIGEIVRYRLAVRLPEGTVADLSLLDNLPNGLTYLNDGTSRAAFVSNGGGLSSASVPGISTIAGNTADPTSVPSGSITFALPAGAISGAPFNNGSDPSFGFGTVINNDNDADNEFLLVEFNALINNTTAGGNDIGENRNNTFTAFNGAAVLAASNSVQVRIAEPQLVTDKIANPTSGDAGDTINFTVTVTSSDTADNSTAFDANLMDTLPATYTNLVVNSITPAGGCAGITDNSAGNTVDIDIATMPPGCSLTVTYSAELVTGVAPGDSIINSATSIWTSLPGSNGTGSGTPGTPGADTGERTGAGGINDYSNTDSATVDIDSVQLAKTVTATSETATGDTQVRPMVQDLVIGETADFQITATIPEGTTPQVIITDTLPFTNGVMEVVSATVISTGNLAVANSPAIISITDDQLTDGLNETVEFDFGQITNTPDGISDANDQIVVQVIGRLVDVPANANLDQLTNGALVQFGAGLNASASAPVDVVEPLLEVNKNSLTTTGDAGDTINFSITVDHLAASTADAQDVLLTDTLPTGLTLVAGSLVVASGPAPVSANEVGNGIEVLWNTITLLEDAEITFSATINNGVMPSEMITNTANLSWTSIAGADANERTSTASNGHTVTITAPGLQKVITATSEPSTGNGEFGPEEDLTIGEQVTYQFTVQIPEGTTNAAMVIDQLPTGSSVLSMVSSRIISIGSNISGATLPPVGDPGVASDSNTDSFNDRVEWNLGNLFNTPDGVPDANDSISFEVIAIVLDQPINQSGVLAQTNTATLNTATSSASGTVNVDLVAPAVTITKTTVTPADEFVDAGDTVNQRLDIDHAMASTADAFNVTISDTLPTGLSWVDDATVVSDCAGLTVDSSTEPLIVFTIPQFTLLANTCDISYDLLVDNTVEAGSTLTNSAVMDYDSTPVFVAGQTRRLMDSDTAEVTVIAPTLVKISTDSNVADTGMAQFDPMLPDLAIGETITYELTIVVPEGVTSNSVVTDLLPADAGVGFMEVIGAVVFSVGSNISTTLPGTPAFDDFQVVDGLNDRVIFDFGMISNSPDGMEDVNDSIVMQVVARVVDVAANAAGDLLVNNASFDFDGGSLTDSADVEVVEPALNLTKNLGPLTDGVVRITLGIANTGTAPAFDINVSDVLEDSIWDTANLMEISVSSGFLLQTVAGPGAGQQTVNFSSDPLAVSPDGTIPAGSMVSAIFDIPLTTLPPTPNPIPNTANLDGGDSLPGNDPSARDVPPDSDSDSIGVPELAASKTAALQVDADASTDISAGDTLRYTIVINNSGAGDATNVLLDDSPDANTTLVVGSVTTSQGTVTIGNTAGDATIQVSAGTIAAAGSVTITYDVVIDTPLASGITQVVNQAMISSTELPPVDSDDPGPGGDEDPTVVPVNAAPDLTIVKDDGGVTVMPGDTVSYSLTYQNVGNQDANGVVITDTVPLNSVFNPAASTVGWVCVPDNSPGSLCSLNIGDLAAGAAPANVIFAVTVDSPLSSGVTAINNSAVINDDGNNGPDPTPGDNTDSDNTPIDAAPDLNLSKDDGGATAVPGGVISYTLSYANVGDQDATGVMITDTVPANTSFDAGSSTAGWVCVPDATAGSVCTLAIGDLATGANGSAVFAVIVENPLAAGVTAINNSAGIADDGNNGPDPTPGDNGDSDTTPVNALPDLVISKDDGGITAVPGDTVVYTLNFQNVGDQDATGVVITDTVPANSTFNPGASTAGWVCAPDNTAGSICTLAIGAVTGAGGGGSVSFAVDVDNPLAAGVDELLNSASIADDGTNGADPTPGNNNDSDNTPLDATPDLSITKDDGDATVMPGDTISYVLNYQNTGDQDATGVMISETVPANSTFNPGSSTAGWVCTPDNNAGSSCVLTIGDLAAGAADTATFAVVVDDPLAAGVIEIINSASIADDGNNGADPTPGDNTDGDTTPVDATPDLTLTKDDGDITAVPGGTINYTLSYANVGNQDATGVVITDTVPADTTFNAVASTPGWVCAPDNNADSVCTFTIGDLAAGTNASVIFAVDVDDPLTSGVDTISNSASIADDGNNGADPTPDDNTDGDTTPVDAQPDLVIVKDDGDVTVAPGGSVTYMLSYQNVGDQNATGVVITDTVPENTTFDPANSTIGWVCAPDNSASSICTLDIGDLAGGASDVALFTVIVDVPVPLGFTEVDNTASIADDGANGADPTPGDNTDGDVTPIMLNPPVGFKTGEVSATGNITWSMYWFNNANQTDLATFIVDNIPDGTVFIPGSITCVAEGTSQCLSTSFNATLNRIEIDTIIAPDFGAANDSTQDVLNNEISITFNTQAQRGGVIINQADAFWDADNDGSASDDEDNGQDPVVSDDPVNGGPTEVIISIEVPTLNQWGLLLMLLLIGGIPLVRRQQLMKR